MRLVCGARVLRLHSTIRNDHFKRNAAWQHCYDIVANGCIIAPTLQRCVALKWLL